MEKAIQIAFNENFEKRCEYASLAGFTEIAVNFHDTVDTSKKAWSEASDKILKIMEKYNLKCVQTHLPYYELRISAEILDDEMEDKIENSIRVGAEIGAPWSVYHPRTAINDGYIRPKNMEINKRVISKYLEWATKYGTGIALENLPIFDGIVPIMPFFTSEYSDLCELADSFNSKDVGICWDTGHANLMDFDQPQAIKYVGDRIKCTHIHNNNKYCDSHDDVDVGNIEWTNVMEAFEEIGYQGPLTLETHCKYPDEEILKSFYRHNFLGLEYLERLKK